MALTSDERIKVAKWIKEYPVGIDDGWWFRDNDTRWQTRLFATDKEECFENG